MSRIAFLGPSGSYSELATISFDSKAERVPCLSIAEAFKKLAEDKVDLTIVPVENIIEGPVTETLDNLFEYQKSLHIHSSLNYRINHCLGSLGDDISKITAVYSKDQPLRQCSKFIATSLTNAALCPTASTGAACELIVKSNDKTLAAIAAEETVKAKGLNILAREISDVINNQTRFIILSKTKPSTNKKNAAGIFVTSIVVSPGKDRQGLLFEILEVISVKHKKNLRSIHSRPDGKGGFVFHLDLEGSEESLQVCLQDLKDYCSRVTGGTADIGIIGSYPQVPFEAGIATPVGIIGGAGKMGNWFAKFFRTAGIETLICDPLSDKTVSLDEISSKCEIIILSVPMSKADVIIKELVPKLKKGSLVVENFSIKQPWLSKLNDLVPAGVEVLGIHTMFGGDIENLRGQNVIVTKVSKSGNLAKTFEDLLYKHGAQVSHFESEEHDKTTAFIQSLIQFMLIGFADTLSESFTNSKAVEAFHTPNSNNVFTTLKRILNLGEDLITDLQLNNSQNKETRKKLIESLSNLSKSLDAKDNNSINDLVAKAKKFFN